jgi:hypothetical protein
MTEFNFDRDAGLITPGVHYFRITSVEERVGDKGPYFMWHLTVEEQSVDNGKAGIYITSLSPAARFKMAEFLDAVEAPPTGRGTPEMFVGRLVRGSVIHEERNEKMQHTIETLLPAGIPQTPAPVAAAPPSPPAQAASPDLLAGEGAATDTTTPPPPQPLPPKSDVPF